MRSLKEKEELKKRIQYLRDVQKLSFRQMAEELGMARKTITQLYRSDIQPQQSSTFFLDAYRDLIGEWFRVHPSLKAKQVFSRLQESGVKIAYPTVVTYTKEFRKKKQKPIFP